MNKYGHPQTLSRPEAKRDCAGIYFCTYSTSHTIKPYKNTPTYYLKQQILVFGECKVSLGARFKGSLGRN